MVGIRDDWYSATVVRVGEMGNAAAYHLIDHDLGIVSLERYNIPRSQGSPHDITHIIRRVCYEHPSHTSLIERAYDLWSDLADETDRDIVYRTSPIGTDPADNDVSVGLKRSRGEHDIPHEVLVGTEINERFPGCELSEDYHTIYQGGGGFVAPG